MSRRRYPRRSRRPYRRSRSRGRRYDGRPRSRNRECNRYSSGRAKRRSRSASGPSLTDVADVVTSLLGMPKELVAALAVGVLAVLGSVVLVLLEAALRVFSSS